MEIFSTIMSFLALIISGAAYYLNKPKLKIEHQGTINYDLIEETGVAFVPSFILKISNLRNIAIEISHVLLPSKGKSSFANINQVIKPFSVNYFYFGNGALAYFRQSWKDKIPHFKKFISDIGLESNLEKQILDTHHPVLEPLFILKSECKNKPQEIKIEIITSCKAYKKKLKIKN